MLPSPRLSITVPPVEHRGLTEADIVVRERRNLADADMQPYHEVQNLMWIKNNSVYSTALKEWDRKAKLLAERVDRMEKRSGDLKNETYQLAGFFSVFQGVVLTAVTQLMQSTRDNTCKKVWSPVILSGLAWVVATIGVYQKLSRIQVIDEERSEEDDYRRVAVRRAQTLRNQGSAFMFSSIEDLPKRKISRKFMGYGVNDFWINKFGPVFVTLSVFTGAFIASYFLIMCDRGLAKIS